MIEPTVVSPMSDRLCVFLVFSPKPSNTVTVLKSNNNNINFNIGRGFKVYQCLLGTLSL